MVTHPPLLLSLLGNEMRWKLVAALVKGDFNVRELEHKVRGKQNLISYHLGRLKKAKLVRESASIADNRETYYSINMAQLERLFFSIGSSLHPALDPKAERGAERKASKPVRVLF